MRYNNDLAMVSWLPINATNSIKMAKSIWKHTTQNMGQGW